MYIKMGICFRCEKLSEPKKWDWDNTFSIWTHITFTIILVQFIALVILSIGVLTAWLGMTKWIVLIFLIDGLIVYLACLPIGVPLGWLLYKNRCRKCHIGYLTNGVNDDIISSIINIIKQRGKNE